MHLLATSSASLDDLVEPIDLAQPPAPMLAVSFADSDLSALAAAWHAERGDVPEMRLACLRDLRHPMSVDLWIERTARHAKVILVRLLGGYDWWRYGCDRLSAEARKQGIALAVLPGEGHHPDERLMRLSTVAEAEWDALLACFREGGPGNMRLAVRRLARLSGSDLRPETAASVPKVGFFDPETGAISTSTPNLVEGATVLILFYRSMLLASDVEPIAALSAALKARGLQAVAVFVPSLKDRQAAEFIEKASRPIAPSVIVASTGFASGEAGEGTLFDRLGTPVLQAFPATTRREAWIAGPRGLVPSDLAMNVVLPELDGRIMAGPIGFKQENTTDDALAFRTRASRSEPDRVAQVADRVLAMVRLQRTPRSDRRVAILMPDYPGAAGRTGYAVGLDVPSSVLAMLHDLKGAGYCVDNIPQSPRALLDLLEQEGTELGLDDYRALAARLPEAAMEKVTSAWGEADRAARFRAARFGNIVVALAPDRGREEQRRADYHDPNLPPRHELIAFGLWLRETMACHAIVHVGAHGTIEWLPSKAVALSRECFPEIVAGPLPVIYPFIVSNPGEAAQAKRRIAAVTIGHLPPPLVNASLDEGLQQLEHLVDEYAQADGLDRRRRDRLARLIVETARTTGIAADANVAEYDDPETALLRIDAWLCDLKDLRVKDGLHVFGRSAPGEADPLRLASAEAERRALLDALDGRHVGAGPSGAPGRGRTDVLPTGRNLYTADPRTMPTPTAYELGKAAADEILREYAQAHGDWPRTLVMDLWGSASLRTGGEEIAQGLALMGCRPNWDPATGRVIGVEVLTAASLGRPRVDVTFRISGLFRDMFPAQIALIDAATAAVAARDESDEENPLAGAMRRSGSSPRRVFGTSPGTYGAGIEHLLSSGAWEHRDELGRAYLAATSHAYGGSEGDGEKLPDAFAEQIAQADLLVHAGDDPGRDLLEGSADAAFIGGFAAAASALGANAELIALDTTDPKRPRARSLSSAIERIVRGRATNPRFIEGQMRHGPRGASEFAETVDRLIAFAETTQAVRSELIDAVHDAYLGNPDVRAFILRENPAAARALAERLAAARRRGLWHPLRNSIDDDLTALIAEASAREHAA